MRPSTPQLPTDAPATAAPRHLKKNALLLLLAVAVVAAAVAFLLPKRAGEPQRSAPAPTRPRDAAPAYRHPAGK